MSRTINLKNQGSSTVGVLLIGISLVTIYFKIDAEDPFNTPKMLILVILGSYLIGHVVNFIRENRVWSNSGDRVVYSMALLFVLALLISTMATTPFLNGLLGDTQRRNGFLSYLMLSIIFLTSYNFINHNLIYSLFTTSVFVGLTLSIYGLFQINGKDFVKWVNPYNAMISTLGNPNFASAMLAVFASISLFAVFLKGLPLFTKICAGLVIPLALFCIIKSDSRQGLVTFFFAVLSYTALILSSKFKKLTLPIIALSFGAVALVILGMLQRGPLAYWLYKDSVSVRGFYWRAGIKMFQENLLTGVGMDRYGAFFKSYREVEYPLRYGYEITSSNAHNTIIQIFSTAGLISGLLYVLILSYVLYSAIKFVKNSESTNRLIIISLLSAWVGFQAQSFISIDNIGVSVWGWLLCGAILGFIKSVRVSEQGSSSKRPVSNKVQINLFQPTISSIAVLVSLLVVVPVYKSETDSYLVKSLGNNLTEQNKDAVYKYSRKVIDNYFADPNYKFRAALYMYDAGFNKESVSIIENLSNADSKNLDYLNGLAYIYVKENNLDSGISTRRKIAELDPWNAENYLSLGSLYVQVNNNASAKENFSKIISFAPNTEIALKAQEILDSLE